MWTIIIILAVGTLAGFLLRKIPKFSQTTDRVSTWIIYLLLFLMGLRVGANRSVMEHPGSIGLQSLIIAIFCIAGSVILSKIIFRFFSGHEK